MKLTTYIPEFQAQAVKLILAQGLTLDEAAKRISIPKGTLANWVSAAKNESNPMAPPGCRSVLELEAEVAKLRKELAVERMEKEVLKRPPRTLQRSRCPVRVHEIRATRLSVLFIVPCLRRFASGFYAALDRPPSQRAQDDERLKIAIKAAHVQTGETYGPLRLHPELISQGFDTGRDRVVRLRQEFRLRCKQKRKFKATTNSRDGFPVADNLLSQTFAPTRPNEVWVTDISYVIMDEGWLYLAGVEDVFTCELVGYAMGSSMTQDLTAQALRRAVRSKRPAPGLTHHSDRGTQYCAEDYRKLVAQFGM
jgi:putative transposase